MQYPRYPHCYGLATWHMYALMVACGPLKCDEVVQGLQAGMALTTSTTQIQLIVSPSYVWIVLLQPIHAHNHIKCEIRQYAYMLLNHHRLVLKFKRGFQMKKTPGNTGYHTAKVTFNLDANSSFKHPVVTVWLWTKLCTAPLSTKHSSPCLLHCIAN